MRINALTLFGAALDLAFAVLIIWCTTMASGSHQPFASHPGRLAAYLLGVALTAIGTHRLLRAHLWRSLDDRLTTAHLQTLPCFKDAPPSSEAVQTARLAATPIHLILALSGLLVITQAIL